MERRTDLELRADFALTSPTCTYPPDPCSGLQVSWVACTDAGRLPTGDSFACATQPHPDQPDTLFGRAQLKAPVGALNFVGLKYLCPPPGSEFPQYVGTGSTLLTPAHLSALRAGNPVVLKFPVQDPDESALMSFEKPPLHIGNGYVKLTPVGARRSSAAPIDVAQVDLSGDPARIQNAHAAIKQALRKLRQGTHDFSPYIVWETRGAASGGYDHVYTQPTMTQMDPDVLHRVVLVGCLAEGITEQQFVARHAKAHDALMTGVRLYVNRTKYEGDRDSLGRPGEQSTHLPEMRRSLMQMGLPAELTNGDCEDSSNLTTTVCHAFRNTPRCGVPAVDVACETMRGYEPINIVCSTSTGHVQQHGAAQVGLRCGEASCREIRQLAAQCDWASTSGTHSTAACLPAGTIAAMIERGRALERDGTCPIGPHLGVARLCEGTGWVSDHDGLDPQQTETLRVLADQVSQASGGRTELVPKMSLADPTAPEFYRAAVHFTHGGRGYFFVDGINGGDPLVAPHFYKLLNHPECLAAVPMHADAPVAQEDAVRRSLVGYTVPVPVLAAGGAAPPRQAEHGIHAILRGAVTDEERTHGTCGGHPVHAYELAQGATVRLVSLK